jgi:oligoendopeptidase F
VGEDIETYKRKVDQFVERFSGSDLSNDDEFLEHLRQLNTLSIEADRVMHYFFYVTSLNSNSNHANSLHEKYQTVISDQDQKLLFLHDIYLNVLRYDGLMEKANNPSMIAFRNYIVKKADEIKYSLPPSSERIIMKMENVFSDGALDSYKNAMDFKFRRKSVLESELKAMKMSFDRSIRKNSLIAISKEYLRPTSRVFFAEKYAETCMRNVVNMEMRSMGKNVMCSRNLQEQMGEEVVNKLISFITDNFSIYHEFLAIKAKALGLKKMGIHDVFAYLSSSKKTDSKKNRISFNDGWNTYMNSVRDPKLKSFSEEMLMSGRVSVFPMNGKVSGAYANYSKYEDEFILLNWTNTLYDAVVLAHEMGHAFHGHLSKKQESLVYDTSLVVAETASIFNETLMFSSLMESQPIKNSRQRMERGFMIMNRLDEIFGTMFRQIAYTNFERECHEAFRDNNHLSADDLDAIWTKHAKAFYGEGVDIPEDLERFRWSSVPHFFEVPFYCYTYSLGNIISLALISQYDKEQDKHVFFERYHNFLSQGGSKSPEDLLMETFGISMDDNFFESSLVPIRSMMDEVRSLFM